MSKITLIITAAGLLFTAVTWGHIIALLLLLLIISALLIWLILSQLLLQVIELEVAVVGDRSRQRFSRFLPAGQHWLRPFEYLAATIPLSGLSVDSQNPGIQTSGGLPLTITWSVSYSLEPLRVQPAKQAKAARVLPAKSAAAVRKQMGNILQHVLGEMTIEALCQPGSHQRLERQIRQQLTARLHDIGFTFSRVMLGPIEMPATIQAALAAAHERRLQTELEAATLGRLHEAIRRFSDSDMARLVELERIHALSRQGVALIYEQPRYDRPVSPPQWQVVNGGYAVKSKR
jgi:hypothetical protein